MIFVFLVIQFILVSYIIYRYNRLSVLRTAAIEALKNIDVQLDKRMTVIKNLSEIVKAYDVHEAELLNTIALERDVSNAKELKTIINRTENNPEIKSSKLYLDNQKYLVMVEGDIQGARIIYNAAATRYNEQRSIVPVIIIAKSFGFYKAHLFEQAPITT